MARSPRDHHKSLHVSVEGGLFQLETSTYVNFEVICQERAITERISKIMHR